MDDATDAMLTNLAVELASVRGRVREIVDDDAHPELSRRARTWLRDLGRIRDELTEARAELRDGR